MLYILFLFNQLDILVMDFKKFYNEHSEYVARRSENNESFKEYIDEIDFKTKELLKVIDQNGNYNSILEVGCSNGILLHSLADKLGIKNKVYGIDISTKNIQDATQRFPKYVFIDGTIESFLETNNEVFDLVILSDIIEHVPDDLGFIKQVSSISKQILINLPLERSFTNRNRNYGETDTSGHLRCYNNKEGVALIEKAGLKIINSNRVISAKESKAIFKNYKLKQIKRLDKKSLSKKIFWKSVYFVKDYVLLKLPSIYRNLYGENLYCLTENKIK